MKKTGLPDYPFSFSLPVVPDTRIVTAGVAEKRLLIQLHKKLTAYEEAVWQLARFYSHTDRQELAAQWVQQLLTLTTDQDKKASYYLALGQFKEQRKDFHAAIDFYKQGISTTTTNVATAYLLHNNLGYSLIQEEEYLNAETCCRRAIAIDPKRHNAYKNLGLSLEGQGKYLEAARAYIKAVQKHATDARALHHLEDLVRRQPQITRMIPGFTESLRGCREAVAFATELRDKWLDKKLDSPPADLTNAAKILKAVAHLVLDEGKQQFTRNEIRMHLGVSRDEWEASYTSIFQSMRADQPGGAPPVRKEFQGVFRQVMHGLHTLTKRGQALIQTRGWEIGYMS